MVCVYSVRVCVCVCVCVGCVCVCVYRCVGSGRGLCVFTGVVCLISACVCLQVCWV